MILLDFALVYNKFPMILFLVSTIITYLLIYYHILYSRVTFVNVKFLTIYPISGRLRKKRQVKYIVAALPAARKIDLFIFDKMPLCD